MLWKKCWSCFLLDLPSSFAGSQSSEIIIPTTGGITTFKINTGVLLVKAPIHGIIWGTIHGREFSSYPSPADLLENTVCLSGLLFRLRKKTVINWGAYVVENAPFFYWYKKMFVNTSVFSHHIVFYFATDAYRSNRKFHGRWSKWYLAKVKI